MAVPLRQLERSLAFSTGSLRTTKVGYRCACRWSAARRQGRASTGCPPSSGSSLNTVKVAYHLHCYLLLYHLDHGRLGLFIHALGGPPFFLSIFEFLSLTNVLKIKSVLLCWVLVYKSFFTLSGCLLLQSISSLLS